MSEGRHGVSLFYMQALNSGEAGLAKSPDPMTPTHPQPQSTTLMRGARHNLKAGMSSAERKAKKAKDWETGMTKCARNAAARSRAGGLKHPILLTAPGKREIGQKQPEG